MKRRTSVKWRWVVVVLVALAACGDGDGDVQVRPAEQPAPPPTAAWSALPEPPLSERTRAVGVWTGHEVLFVGGDRFACPPNAGCSAPLEPPLADGAALDLSTRTWRTISDAPVAFHSASSAVVLGDVYVLAHTDYDSGISFLRYDVEEDTWSQPPPPAESLAWHRLVAAGDRLIAYVATEESGVTGDQMFDPATEQWRPLPEDPMSTAFDRNMVWAEPYVYLFDKENVPQPGSERPSIVRAARLELAAGVWERLPDSEIIGGWGMWVVDGSRLVNPYLGSADGGEVNGWGAAHQYGGILDTATATWHPLPDGAPAAEYEGAITPTAGAITRTSAAHVDVEGYVLDLAAGDWWHLDPPPTDTPETTWTIVNAGRDAVAFDGTSLWLLAQPAS